MFMSTLFSPRFDTVDALSFSDSRSLEAILGKPWKPNQKEVDI
jgi:hypothetical protein